MEYCKYDSPLGPLWLVGHDGILTGLSFEEPRGEYTYGTFQAARDWLDDYFLGILRKRDFQIDLVGTPFQKLIWNFLLEIPYGETVTYGDLAQRAATAMGREIMSAQAVGQAVGRNPIAIIIPCHRVVGANGAITGYAGGLDKKRLLLAHEGIVGY